MPTTTPNELSRAMIECIDAGAKILNLSLAIVNPSAKEERELDEALSYAAKRGVLVVVAAGNQENVGVTAITRHPWTIPIVACNAAGKLLPSSNLGISIGQQGFSAPGENITSLGSDGRPQMLSGTSSATPFVTGALALLWSEFPYLWGGEIKYMITQFNQRRSIIPPLFNASAFYQLFNSFSRKKNVA